MPGTALSRPAGACGLLGWDSVEAPDARCVGSSPSPDGRVRRTSTAVNNNGQVVGSAQTSTDADHGFLWSSGKMTDLGLNFFPAAVNDNGVVVGGSMIHSGGTLRNLNNLIPPGSGFTLDDATGLNGNGQIVAHGDTPP